MGRYFPFIASSSVQTLNAACGWFSGLIRRAIAALFLHQRSAEIMVLRNGHNG
jgi:hypothetical protein